MNTIYSIGEVFDFSGFDYLETGFYFVELSKYPPVIIVVTFKLAINVLKWNAVVFIGFLIGCLGTLLLYWSKWDEQT